MFFQVQWTLTQKRHKTSSLCVGTSLRRNAWVGLGSDLHLSVRKTDLLLRGLRKIRKSDRPTNQPTEQTTKKTKHQHHRTGPTPISHLYNNLPMFCAGLVLPLRSERLPRTSRHRTKSKWGRCPGSRGHWTLPRDKAHLCCQGPRKRASCMYMFCKKVEKRRRRRTLFTMCLTSKPIDEDLTVEHHRSLKAT